MKGMTIKRLHLVAIVAAIVLTAACGGKQESAPAQDADSLTAIMPSHPGDSTIYGLACEGCNDTLLIFLPRIDADPDTFNILEASRNHQVFGRMKIGDIIAAIPNKENPKVADMVINLEYLKGKWCYMVKPQLRERAGMSSKDMANRKRSPEADSMLQVLLRPREFGFELKSDNVVRPISGLSPTEAADKNSPAVFPPIKRYRNWIVSNGKLILSETSRDSLGNTTITTNDTATLVLLRRDTLVLRFNDKEQGYYRKTEEDKQ